MPSVQKVHVDKMLTNISIGYSNEQYIADKIFLPVSVAKQSDKYYIFGKEMFRQHDDRRAPGTEANEINWSLSDDAYYCDGHALRHAIPDEEMQNADDGFNLESDATELVTEGILLNKEIDAASKVLDMNSYESDLIFNMGASDNPKKWSDYLTGTCESDPVLDIQIAKERLHKKSGIRPNTLIIAEPVLNVLKLHPKMLKLFSGVSATSVLTMEQLKLVLNVDDILVGSALKSTALNPGQEDSLEYIWGNSAVLAFIPKRPAKKQVALGYSFMWNKDGNGAVQVRKWYEQGRRATIVEAERWYDQKIVSKVAGFLFADAITPIGA